MPYARRTGPFGGEPADRRPQLATVTGGLPLRAAPRRPLPPRPPIWL